MITEAAPRLTVMQRMRFYVRSVDQTKDPQINAITSRYVWRAPWLHRFSLNSFERCRYCDEARARMAVSRASCLG